ncbi:MAG: shikimate kinase [Patescibacteria group bacterium UBA2103]
MKLILLIGPASVGKTTIGNLLAQKLGYTFIDVDSEFCTQIENIGTYIDTKGYDKYCEKNSELTKLLSETISEPAVLATSSGFLVHTHLPEVIKQNEEILATGYSILFLPSPNPEQDVEMIAERQLKRWNGLDKKREKKKFLERFEQYKKYGNITIHTNKPSDDVVAEIIEKLPN